MITSTSLYKDIISNIKYDLTLDNVMKIVCSYYDSNNSNNMIHIEIRESKLRILNQDEITYEHLSKSLVESIEKYFYNYPLISLKQARISFVPAYPEGVNIIVVLKNPENYQSVISKEDKVLFDKEKEMIDLKDKLENHIKDKLSDKEEKKYKC